MRWVRRAISVLVFAVSLMAFLGIPVPLPFDVKTVVDLAIDADLWIINHSAYPGLFLVVLVLAALLMLPDLWRGFGYLREKISGRPRLRVTGPHLHQHYPTIKQWRMLVENLGRTVARNVRMQLTAISPRPRYAGWGADYPYPVRRVTAPGLEHSPCNVSPSGAEHFEVLSGWLNAQGLMFTDGLDTKHERNRIQIDHDERWRLFYRVTSDNVDACTFTLIAYVYNDNEVIVEQFAPPA